MTPMGGTDHHFGPFLREGFWGAISGGPLFSRPLGLGAWGPRKEGLGEGLAEKVGNGLAKGWRRVGEGLAQGWRRVGGFPCTLHFRNSRGARLETRVCDSMVSSQEDFHECVVISVTK